MIGAIIGDVAGSRFEFHNILRKDFKFFAPGCTYTDDTVMTCAVAQALMDSKPDYSDLSEKTVTAMQRIGQQCQILMQFKVNVAYVKAYLLVRSLSRKIRIEEPFEQLPVFLIMLVRKEEVHVARRPHSGMWIEDTDGLPFYNDIILASFLNLLYKSFKLFADERVPFLYLLESVNDFHGIDGTNRQVVIDYSLGSQA